ncbi:MAG TPA: hypothetical protein VKD23_16365 [Terriglobales bacterium]|nr:hypothetical protein [Terriglobales bacterium]
MSKKNMGSSIDDFLKKENIFEEAQAQAIKEVVAWQLARAMKKKDFQGAHGGVAEDEPLPGRSHSRSETRHHAVEFAAGGGIGGTASGD